MEPLEQVMGEKRVFRNGAFERRREGIDVVESLTGEDAFAEEVLVGVGDGRRVGIDPGMPGIQPRKQRAGGAHESDADARLQDAVAFGDTASLGIERRAVEGMNDDADQLAGHTARKPCIAVESDAVPDLRQDGQIAH